VLAARGPASPYVAALQRLEHLPVEPGRLYAEKSLYWVIWYLGLPALLLGVLGLAAITRRCLRALLTWRDPAGAARVWALPLAIIGWSFFAVLWQPDTVPDQPWASRRLVPVVLPGLVVAAVWVAAWFTHRARQQGAGAAVPLAAACFVLALAIPPAAITFNVGPLRPAPPSVRVALAGLAFRSTGAGELGAVRLLCGALPQHSTVLILDQPAARAFAPGVRGICGVPTAALTGATPASIGAVVAGIEQAGRRPVLLAGRPSELVPYDPAPRRVVNLVTQEDAHLLTQPATATWTVRYQLWMAAPGGTFTGS
jgi:hypothetical protein